MRVLDVNARPDVPASHGAEPRIFDEIEEDTHVDGQIIFRGLERVNIGKGSTARVIAHGPSAAENHPLPSSSSLAPNQGRAVLSAHAAPQGGPAVPTTPRLRPRVRSTPASVAPLSRGSLPAPNAATRPVPAAPLPPTERIDVPPQTAPPSIPGAWPTPQRDHPMPTPSASQPAVYGNAQPAPWASSSVHSSAAHTAFHSGAMKPHTLSGGHSYESGGLPGMRAMVKPARYQPLPEPADRGFDNWLGIAAVVIMALVVGSATGLGVLTYVSSLAQHDYAYTRAAPPLPDIMGIAPAVLPQAPFIVEPPSAYTFEGAPDAQAVTQLGEAQTRFVKAATVGDLQLATLWSDRATRLSLDPYTYAVHAARLAQVGAVDAAYYWLTRAIHEVGLPPSTLVEETRYAHLWDDKRWEDLAKWTVARNRYFAANPDMDAIVWMPDGTLVDLYAPVATAPTPADDVPDDDVPANAAAPSATFENAILWLSPTDADTDRISRWGPAIATAWGLPVIALDGPIRIGPHATSWNTDSVRARVLVEDALTALDKHGVKIGRATLIGMGDAAQVAIDLVLRSPSRFSNVLALTPSNGSVNANSSRAILARDQKALLVSPIASADRLKGYRALRAELVRSGIEASLIVDEAPWPSSLPAHADARLVDWLSVFIPTPNTPRFPTHTPDATHAPTRSLQTAPVPVRSTPQPTATVASPQAENTAIDTKDEAEVTPTPSGAHATTAPTTVVSPATPTATPPSSTPISPVLNKDPAR